MCRLYTALKPSWNLEGVEPGNQEGPETGASSGTNQNAPFSSK